jgi:hypothetical protein
MPLSSDSNSSSDLNNKIGLNEKLVQQRWGLVLKTWQKKKFGMFLEHANFGKEI